MIPHPIMSHDAPAYPYSHGEQNHSLPNGPTLRQEGSLLSILFFSGRNVDVIQTSLRYRVYRDSGGQFVVGRQSDIALLAIMRDVYESSERHVPDARVIEAVKMLNEHVLRRAVPDVISAVKFHKFYVEDISHPNPVPGNHPSLVSSKGSKVLQPFRT
jgi:hypothetical protein